MNCLTDGWLKTIMDALNEEAWRSLFPPKEEDPEIEELFTDIGGEG